MKSFRVISYKPSIQNALAAFSLEIRKRRGLSQEKMAEQLHISTRAYSDIERALYSFSVYSFTFLLLMLDPIEINELIGRLRSKMEYITIELEHEEQVDITAKEG